MTTAALKKGRGEAVSKLIHNIEVKKPAANRAILFMVSWIFNKGFLKGSGNFSKISLSLIT